MQKPIVFFTLLARCTPAVSPPKSEPQFEVPVRAMSDGDVPVAGVALRVGNSPATLTGADGVARLRLRGRTGDELEVHATCPDGYASPPTPTKVTLYRVVAGAAPPARTLTCERASRRIVAAIRTTHAARLPIVRFGHEIGATDATGVAHVLVEGRPGEHVDLLLDTAESGLRPKSPTLSFVIPPRDEIVFLEQSFDKPKVVEPKPQPRVRRAVAKEPTASTLPTRI